MKKLTRSVQDRTLAGECGGCADLMNLDPTLVRLGVVLAAFLTAIAPVMLAYLVAWVIVPEAPVESGSGPGPPEPPPPPGDGESVGP